MRQNYIHRSGTRNNIRCLWQQLNTSLLTKIIPTHLVPASRKTTHATLQGFVTRSLELPQKPYRVGGRTILTQLRCVAEQTVFAKRPILLRR